MPGEEIHDQIAVNCDIRMKVQRDWIEFVPCALRAASAQMRQRSCDLIVHTR
jgi:hypothetical protein